MGRVADIGDGVEGVAVGDVGAHEVLLSGESAPGRIREMTDGRGAQGVFDLARAGAIDLHVERYGIDEAPEAYARLHDGKVKGRAVVFPG